MKSLISILGIMSILGCKKPKEDTKVFYYNRIVNSQVNYPSPDILGIELNETELSKKHILNSVKEILFELGTNIEKYPLNPGSFYDRDTMLVIKTFPLIKIASNLGGDRSDTLVDVTELYTKSQIKLVTKNLDTILLKHENVKK